MLFMVIMSSRFRWKSEFFCSMRFFLEMISLGRDRRLLRFGFGLVDICVFLEYLVSCFCFFLDFSGFCLFC